MATWEISCASERDALNRCPHLLRVAEVAEQEPQDRLVLEVGPRGGVASQSVRRSRPEAVIAQIVRCRRPVCSCRDSTKPASWRRPARRRPGSRPVARRSAGCGASRASAPRSTTRAEGPADRGWRSRSSRFASRLDDTPCRSILARHTYSNQEHQHGLRHRAVDPRDRARRWGDLPQRLARRHASIAYDGAASTPRRDRPADAQPSTPGRGRPIERSPPRRRVVVGWSIGGVIALELAHREPALVSRPGLARAAFHAKRRPRPAMVRAIVGATLLGRRGRSEAAPSASCAGRSHAATGPPISTGWIRDAIRAPRRRSSPNSPSGPASTSTAARSRARSPGHGHRGHRERPGVRRGRPTPRHTHPGSRLITADPAAATPSRSTRRTSWPTRSQSSRSSALRERRSAAQRSRRRRGWPATVYE